MLVLHVLGIGKWWGLPWSFWLNPASAAIEVFASANWLGQSTLPGRLASRNAPRWARGLELERICCRVRHGWSKKLGNDDKPVDCLQLILLLFDGF